MALALQSRREAGAVASEPVLVEDALSLLREVRNAQLDARRASGLSILHEESSDPEPSGCKRWPVTMRLRSSEGEVVFGRCGSSNKCEYCARLVAVENAEMLALDAVENEAPALWAVLTTSCTIANPAHYYRAVEAVAKAMRRRWPAFEYAMLLEFTTGYGTRARGRRRPHFNLLIKGVPRDELYTARDVIRRVWCGRDELAAAEAAQFVGEVSEFGGLMRYIALHFQKESQAPPEGWRGHRFRTTRGYFADSAREARSRARESLRFKREVYRIGREQPFTTAEERDLLASVVVELRRDVTWRIDQVYGHSRDPDPVRYERAAFRNQPSRQVVGFDAAEVVVHRAPRSRRVRGRSTG